ncbi:CMP-N-acetylneuraminate-beta-galactosamide-alpha-2,3-sialyltransferase 2-like isoform X2 [Pseudoliparis swirei]|uniref:CMP-N-acetylneuraminate-beta-galactosamide- alpha-2,3-sialyltransferase 2-like isoform X2 n=1 Tax=Pseudoliparis swirei TaxID=2059687 RepID=UPI0024BE5E2D|nr:CMP-N-acetylneuraminate-beta-galactosamide-alpha-2,3-sialyltransferase 2-like isoform X2 [Pseudoliparis swirei]
MTWSCLRSLRFRCLTSKVGVFILLLCVTGICVFWRAETPSYQPPREERHCACDRCLRENGTLFLQRFDKFDEPFLSANHNLSEEAFNWWSRLRSNNPTFSSYIEVVKKIFQKFPKTPELEPPSPDRCRTCALVGNSANLNGSHYGPLIDFQDFVIRINNAPMKGYEKDVGTRTTHHVMYPESSVNLDDTTHLLLFAFKMRDLVWITKYINSGIRRGRTFNTDLMSIVNPAFIKFVHQVWLKKKGYYPSTGFLALILTLHLCDEVHLFGFGADSEGQWRHYWEELRNKLFKTGVHAGNVEFAMIKELSQNQIIKYYGGY